MENGSNTPDYILADYLSECLAAFDKAVSMRERFYGRAREILSTNCPQEPIIVETDTGGTARTEGGAQEAWLNTTNTEGMAGFDKNDKRIESMQISVDKIKMLEEQLAVAVEAFKVIRLESSNLGIDKEIAQGALDRIEALSKGK